MRVVRELLLRLHTSPIDAKTDSGHRPSDSGQAQLEVAIVEVLQKSAGLNSALAAVKLHRDVALMFSLYELLQKLCDLAALTAFHEWDKLRVVREGDLPTTHDARLLQKGGRIVKDVVIADKDDEEPRVLPKVRPGVTYRCVLT
jgi:hypothetical protein